MDSLPLVRKALSDPGRTARAVLGDPGWAARYLTGVAVSKIIHLFPEGESKNTVRAAAFSRFSGWFPVPRAGLIDRGDSVVSVGAASPGQVHTLAHLAGRRGTVLLVEPSPTNHDFLEPATAEYDHVVLDKRGAWREAGTHTMKLAPEDYPADHKLEVENVEHDNDYRHGGYDDEVDVTVAPLDDILCDHGVHPDYVEIMVNGAELEVLRGASEMLDADGPRLWVKGHARDEETGEPLNERIVPFLEEDHDYETAVTRGGERTVGTVEGWERRDGDVFAYRQGY